MAKQTMEETFGGYVLHTVPFPTELDEAALAALKRMTPILIEQPYSMTYLHSYAQDSPFFAGLSNGTSFGQPRSGDGLHLCHAARPRHVHGNETDWSRSA